MAVQQEAVEFKALQEARLCHQRTVVGINLIVLHVWLLSQEIVIVTQACGILIRYNKAIIDRSLIRAASDVAIEHTVHHHRTDVCLIER